MKIYRQVQHSKDNEWLVEISNDELLTLISESQSIKNVFKEWLEQQKEDKS